MPVLKTSLDTAVRINLLPAAYPNFILNILFFRKGILRNLSFTASKHNGFDKPALRKAGEYEGNTGPPQTMQVDRQRKETEITTTHRVSRHVKCINRVLPYCAIAWLIRGLAMPRDRPKPMLRCCCAACVKTKLFDGQSPRNGTMVNIMSSG